MTTTVEALAAYTAAGRYARGETIFASVLQHGAEAVCAAIEHAEDVIPPFDNPQRGRILDVIDVLEMAARELV